MPECESPPYVSRGLDSQNAEPLQKIDLGVHWLRGSVKAEESRKLTEYLAIWFGNDHVNQKFGLWFFDRSTRWPNGVMLNYHSDTDRQGLTNGLITVEIPGTALDALGMRALGAFMFGLRQFEFQCGRVD